MTLKGPIGSNPAGPRQGADALGIVRMLLLAVAVCLLGVACVLVLTRGWSNHGAPATSTVPAPAESGPAAGITVGIAYGTEKRRWLESAADQFARTPQGAGIKIDLIPMGSLEGAQAILRGDQQAHRINVWSPASSLYEQSFVQDWQVKYGNNPIAASERLALTPMVFVFWDERYQAFSRKY
ncbi:MAG TPA: substrate-binding domain-containing protein, partial [Tepidisphaeraceae bacterium]